MRLGGVCRAGGGNRRPQPADGIGSVPCRSATSWPPRRSVPQEIIRQAVAGRAGRLRLRRDERPLPPVAGRAGPLAVHLERARRDRGADQHASAWPPASPARPCATTRRSSRRPRRPWRWSPTAGSPSAWAPASGSTSTSSASGFPSVRGRHERLREALEIIRLLWQGGYQSYEGKHLQLEDARVFDLPDTLPVIAVAASGRGIGAARRRAGRRRCSPPSRTRRSSSTTDAPGGSGPALRRGAAGLGHRRGQQAVQAVLRDEPVGGDRLEGDERAAQPGQLRRRQRVRRPEKHIRQLFAVGPDPDRTSPRSPVVRRRRLRPPRPAERRPRPGRLPRLLRRRPRRPSARDWLTPRTCFGARGHGPAAASRPD